jgi:putative membrane protein
LPNQGIGATISAAQWDEVMKAVVTKLKANDIAGGFCAGIERCGVILAQVCPAKPGDNPDELPDRLVQEP